MKKKAGARGILLMDLSQSERERYGCIVDFSDGRARWFPGTSGLREATEYADANGLRIKTVSTPSTIFRDLQGTRAKDAHGERGRQGSRLVAGVVVFPEQHMLGLLGRQDLLALERQPRDRSRRKGVGSKEAGPPM